MPDQQTSIEHLAALHREATDLARRLSVDQHDSAAQFVGGDPAGAVEVTLDGDGRPCEVRLDPQWRRLVGAQGLGPAVVTASANASAEHFAEWARAVGRPETPSYGPGVGVTGQAASSDRVVSMQSGEPGDSASSSSAGSIRDLLALLDTFEAQLDEVITLVERQATQAVTGRSPDRWVTATIAGGALTSVEVDPLWLASAERDGLAGSIRDALRAAHGMAARAAQRALAGSASVRDVQAMTVDPEYLLRRLGLLR